MSTTATSIPADAIAYIEALTGSADTICTWQIFDDSAQKAKGKARIIQGTLAEVLEQLQRCNEGGCGVFVCVNGTDLKGRKAKNVVKIRALFIDHDKGVLPPWHLPPSIIVYSKAGPHAYWLVLDCNLEAFGPAQKRLIAYYGSDPKIWDLNRVLRVPGFLHKKAEPQPVMLAESHADRVYTLEEILKGLDPLPTKFTTPIKKNATTTTTDKQRYHGDWRKIDLPSLFTDAGLYRRDLGEGKHAVICPWESEHTAPDLDPTSGGSGTVIWAGDGERKAGFHCSHAHCEGRKLPEVLDFLKYDVGAEQARADVRAWQAELLGDPLIDWPVAKRNKRGEVIGPSKVHRENTDALLQAYSIEIRHNLMVHAPDIRVRDFIVAPERRQNATLAKVLELAERNGLSERQTLKHLQILAVDWHPVREWILSRPWDGIDRIGQLRATIGLAGSADEGLVHLLLDRWLVGCACAVMKDFGEFANFKPQGVLTFQGKQSLGKTSWLMALAPTGSGWIGEGLNLDPHDRDSIQKLTAHWIAELGEVDATFKKADIAALKAFLIRDVDTYRSAYDRREEKIPRRTMLAATVNRPDFLVDPTGNRRWWTAPIETLDWKHGIDMQQLWAQVYILAQQGAPWHLDKHEEARLAASNSKHDQVNALKDEILATYTILPSSTDVRDWLPLKEIAMGLPTYRVREPTEAEQNRIAKILIDLGADRGPNKGHTATGNRWPLRGSPSLNPLKGA